MSSDGKVVVEYISNMGAVLRDQAELVKSLGRTVQAFDKVAGVSKTARANLTEEGRAAARVTAEHMTTAERLKAKQTELNSLFEKTAISYETWRRGTAAVDAETKKLESSGRVTFGSIVEGAGRSVIAMASIATAAGAIYKAWQLVNSEIDAGVGRMERAADHTLSLKKPTRSFARNLGVNSDLSIEQGVARVQEIAAKTGAGQAATMEAAGGVASARGKFSMTEALQSLESVATLDPSLSGEEMRKISGNVLDIRKAFGLTDKQALGMIMAGQQTARVETFEQYSQGVVPAVLGLANEAYDLTAQEAFGLTSAISQIGGFTRGEMPATAALQFAAQIIEKTKKAGFEGTFSERLEFLKSDPRGQPIRRQMVGVLGAEEKDAKRRLKPGEELTGEVKAKPAMIGILTPGSKGEAEYFGAMSGIPDAAGAEAYYQKTLAEQDKVSLLRVAKVDERLNAVEETMKSDPARAMQGVVLRRLRSLDSEIGINSELRSSIENRFRQMTFGGMSESVALERTIGEVEGRAWDVYEQENQSWFGRVGDWLGGPGDDMRRDVAMMPNAPWRTEAGGHSALLQAAGAMRELVEQMKRQETATRPPNGPRPDVMQPSPTP